MAEIKPPPCPAEQDTNSRSAGQDTNKKQEKLCTLYRELITSLGEDTSRDGLLKTPERAARAMQYIMRGYGQCVEDVLNGALFDTINQDMVIIKNIEYYSICEHHMLPFFGKCHVGYLPKDKVIGLSKIARLVDVFSRRLQVQENLTRQIADAIVKTTKCRGVGVVMEGQHLCMMMRGIEKQGSSTTTSVMLGLFRTRQATRNEFLGLINSRS